MVREGFTIVGFYYNLEKSTLQKFTERISGTLLGKIISSFIILTKIGQLFIGIDSSGFKATHASQYYTERTKLTRRRRKYINYH
jgi:hypothetical protein